MLRRPPTSPLFPYTTLFRSRSRQRDAQPFEDARARPPGRRHWLEPAAGVPFRAGGRNLLQNGDVLGGFRRIARRGVHRGEPCLHERRARHEGVCARDPGERRLGVTELELRLAGEEIEEPQRWIIGGREADRLLDRAQSVFRLAHAGQQRTYLAARMQEAWVELEAALKRFQARIVLAAVLLQQAGRIV